MMEILTLIGVAAVGWYGWVAVLGYKACRRGGHTLWTAVKWAATWPRMAHETIKNSYR